MTDKQIIFKCDVDCIRKNTEECFELDCIKGQESILKQLQAKEQECEKAKQNAQDTYDLWQALIESFNILQGEKIKLEQECEELKKQLTILDDEDVVVEITVKQFEEYKKLKQTLAEIIRFFKEDKKFARYSGYPIVFTKSALEEIEKILKENDIKISECEVGNE